MKFQLGDMIEVTHKNSLDMDYAGRFGVFIETTGKGYARVRLYGDADERELLLHPESLRLHHRSEAK
jgi:ribosomal protein L21E